MHHIYILEAELHVRLNIFCMCCRKERSLSLVPVCTTVTGFIVTKTEGIVATELVSWTSVIREPLLYFYYLSLSQGHQAEQRRRVSVRLACL